MSLLLLRIAKGFKGAFFAFLLTAAGGACISSAAIVLMPVAFFGAKETTASLNLGNVFFALGALMAPALADVLLRSAGFSRSLGLLAVLCLAPGVITLFLPPEAVPPPQETDVLAVLAQPILWLAAGVFFLYAPLEGCLHTWASTYLHNLGHEEREAHRLISGFWTSFLAGRLVAAYLLHTRWLPEQPERWMLCLLVLGATVMVGNLVGTANKGGATTGLLLLGFFLGPIFPTLVGFLLWYFAATPGTVFGVLFTLGSAGSLFFAPFISARISRSTAQSALRIPLFLGLLLLVLSLVFALWHMERG
jgi:fucose permease